ncbi:MAG: transporter substrate-binding domain-containing protein [Methylocystaceae bacterium]|nr:transporter substrate-binding domain-containing protein [Methylocystaceae bacterium]
MVLTFACNEFPPHKMEKSADGLPGFDVEVLKQAFSYSNININVEYYPWKRALENTKSGIVDGLCSCSKSQGRDTWLAYSDQMGSVGIGHFYHPNHNKSDHFSPLSPTAVVRGYAIQNDLAYQGIKVIRVNNDKVGIRMLLNDRVKAFYSYRDTGKYILSKQPFDHHIEYSEARSSPYFTCISKKRPDYPTLIDQFNTGLKQLHETGAYDAIMNKYR